MHSVLWTRLDRPGHDACRFVQTGDEWRVEGAAVFEHDGKAAHLTYRLSCSPQWQSLEARVQGWIGADNIDLRIEGRRNGDWSVNGTVNDALHGLNDIDLGFTPATNTNAIRRLDLTQGDGAASVAVWLDTDDWAVKPLPQSYRRISQNRYDYGSPLHDYRAVLKLDDFGAVAEYPGLWSICQSQGS